MRVDSTTVYLCLALCLGWSVVFIFLAYAFKKIKRDMERGENHFVINVIGEDDQEEEDE